LTAATGAATMRFRNPGRLFVQSNAISATHSSQPDKRRRWLSAACAIVFPCLLFAHNPNLLLHAEFWAEDGPVWYAQAYQSGWHSLLIPDGGYLNSVQRLVAVLCQPFPLHWAPTLFVLFALLTQCSVAWFLISARMDQAWPDRRSRFLFALLYLLMPNAPETAGNLTDSQWYLAPLAFLVLASAPPRRWYGELFDGIVLMVSGLSGPFGILLTPVAAWEIVAQPRAERGVRLRRLVALGAPATLQACLILGLSMHTGRVSGALGASPELLVRILAMIPLGATLGYNSLLHLSTHAVWNGFALPLAATACAVALMLPAAWRGNRMLRQFMYFAGLVFALALAKPLISFTQPQWPLILQPGSGNRYFLYPMLAWWGGLFVLTGARERLLRLPALLLLLLTVLWAIPSDWGDQFHMPANDFASRARMFEKAPPGTRMTFPIHPPDWNMTLVKKGMPKAVALPVPSRTPHPTGDPVFDSGFDASP
jgi:hypothetical protein